MRGNTKMIGGLLALLLVVALIAACGNEANNAGNSGVAGGAEGTSAADSGGSGESNDAGAGATAGATTSADVRELTDEYGNSVAVPAQAQHVVAMGMDDYLVALGLKPAIRYPYRFLDPWLEGVPEASFTPGITPELALEHEADLIIAGWEMDEEEYKSFSKVAPTYLLKDAWSQDWREVTKKLGDLLGRSAEATQTLADYDARLAEIRAKIRAEEQGWSAVMLYVGQGSLWVFDSDKKDVLYEGLGFERAKLAQNAELIAKGISLELLPELEDADFIFLQTNEEDSQQDRDAALAVLTDNPLWSKLPAVQAGRVHAGVSDIWRGNAPTSNMLAAEEVLEAVLKAGQ